MDYIFDINIDARFGEKALESSIKIKLKLCVWKCKDGKFGVRTVWCPYVIETRNTCEYGNNANAQDETLNSGLHILQFCVDGIDDDDDEEEEEVTTFNLSIAFDTHGFDGRPFSWYLLRGRCDLNWHCMPSDATMRVTLASEPDATTLVALPGQL
jgi:hypothetical protein